MIGIDTASLGRISVDSRRSSNSLQNSVGRLLHSGNAAESLRGMGDGGGLSMVSRMGAENRSKSNLAKSMQNAVSYIQTQEATLRKAHQIYERMSVLASRAMDTMITDSTRATLSAEFETLRQDSLNIRSETYQGKVLFDDIAAFVKEDVQFGEGFTESSVTDPSIGLTVGVISGSSDYNSYYEFEKDVFFSSGDFKIEVNGGGNGERYILKQGSATIFDTVSKWATAGTAYKYDFDRFDINFAPGSNTTFTFTPQSRGDNQDVRGSNGTIGKIDPVTLTSDDPDDIAPPPDDGIFDNKSKYLSNLGLTDDGTSSGMGTRTGTKYTNQGQINTGQATGETTKLTLRVEANSIFQIRASYSVPTTPSNYVDVGDASSDSVTLDPIGLGLLQNVSIATANDAASAVSSLAKEIEGIGVQMATLGANLSELEIAGERLNNQVYLSEAGISRLTSDVMATESTELAKQQIRLQSSQALMAQAFSLSENILTTLL